MKAHPIHSDYMITEDGAVYNTKHYGKNIISLKSQSTDKDGYNLINIRIDGKGKTYKVHRLVAETYIPNPNNFPEVNHIDEDKSNNSVSNLEWCTRQYNAQHSLAKSWIVENVRTGERQIVHNLNAFCRQLGLTPSNLLYTLTERKQHKGYKIIERIERTK